MTADLLAFPDRLGAQAPRTQWDALRHMKSSELLAALMTKYPNCTFTSDELRAAQGGNVSVQAVGPNEWTMTPIATHAAWVGVL